MPADLWPLLPLFTVVAGLACLVVAVTLWFLAARNLKKTQSQTEQHLGMLTQRLLKIESRIAELETNNRRAPTDHLNQTRHTVPGESKQNRRPQSLVEGREDLNARSEPTLIAIPDLGAVEADSEGRAVAELGERHGEAWTLAAAGVSPEEIARQTGQPIGQIELIVGLYRRLQSSRGSIDHARSH
jgi:hypothetical protein